MSDQKKNVHHNELKQTLFISETPEEKTSGGGNPFYIFKASRSKKREEQKGDKTYEKRYRTFCSVMCFGQHAEKIKELDLHEGDLVLFEGYYDVREWKNEDGSWGSMPELRPFDIEVVRRKDEGYQKPEGSVPDRQPMSMDDNEIPF